VNTFHEYLRLLLGLIVTVILGAWLAEQFRVQGAQYDTAAQVFQAHSELLGERISAMADLLHAMKDKSAPDAVTAPMTAYRSFLGGYNAKRNYNRALIELYYGEPIYNEERDLHYQLRYIGQELECAYKTKKPVDSAALDNAINQSWERLSVISKHMGQALRDNQIGRSRPMTAATPTKDEPNFTCEGEKV
jgi:hypothetical protein